VLPRDLNSCSEVPRSKAEGLRWLEPTPFALNRFRPAPSGFRFLSSTSDLNPPPLLSSGCLSPRSFTSAYQMHPHAHANAPLMGFRSLQRATESGVLYTPAVPPASTDRPQGFSPSRRLSPPKTMEGLFHPSCAPGIPSDLDTSYESFDSTGVTRPSFLFMAFSSPTTSTF